MFDNQGQDHVSCAAARPAISVVLPTYQRAHIVGDAILSVLQQTYFDFELLVVDDGSTDETAKVVSSFKDQRLRLVSVEHGGRSRARNEGARRAQSEVLVFLDSDDQASPTWLERLHAAFDNPAIAAVCCGARVTAERPAFGGRAETIILPYRLGPVYANRVGLFRAGTFAVRRRVFEAIGGYDCRLAFSENTELGIRLALHCEEQALSLAAVREPLIRIRRRLPVLGAAEARERLEAAERILRRHGDRYRLTPSLYANYRAIAAVNASRLGLSSLAIRHSVAAAAADPGRLVHWGRLTLAFVRGLASPFWARQPQASRADQPALVTLDPGARSSSGAR